MYIINRSVLSVPGESELPLLPFVEPGSSSLALGTGNLFRAS